MNSMLIRIAKFLAWLLGKMITDMYNTNYMNPGYVTLAAIDLKP